MKDGNDEPKDELIVRDGNDEPKDELIVRDGNDVLYLNYCRRAVVHCDRIIVVRPACLLFVILIY